jgi:formylmethanofuran dehydrogenase subunit E
MAARDGSIRSGIILGIRMAILGLRDLGEERDEERNVVVFVETDRCLPDAIELVTGCRLGNRRLKFKDMGKMAATFMDLASRRAIRVAAREGFDRRAEAQFPGLDREGVLVRSYLAATDDELFTRSWVRAEVAPEDVPGYHAERTVCSECGEGISFGREIRSGSRTRCLACAGQSYYQTA